MSLTNKEFSLYWRQHCFVHFMAAAYVTYSIMQLNTCWFQNLLVSIIPNFVFRSSCTVAEEGEERENIQWSVFLPLNSASIVQDWSVHYSWSDQCHTAPTWYQYTPMPHWTHSQALPSSCSHCEYWTHRRKHAVKCFPLFKFSSHEPQYWWVHRTFHWAWNISLAFSSSWSDHCSTSSYRMSHYEH